MSTKITCEHEVTQGGLGAQVEGATTLRAAKEAASEKSNVTFAEQLHLDRLLGGKKSDQWCAAWQGMSMLGGTVPCMGPCIPVCIACKRDWGRPCRVARLSCKHLTVSNYQTREFGLAMLM